MIIVGLLVTFLVLYHFDDLLGIGAVVGLLVYFILGFVEMRFLRKGKREG
ncbi:MAG: hypothetical protein AABX59_03500 [Nanoarchaeota archaeon]